MYLTKNSFLLGHYKENESQCNLRVLLQWSSGNLQGQPILTAQPLLVMTDHLLMLMAPTNIHNWPPLSFENCGVGVDDLSPGTLPKKSWGTT